MEQLSRTMSFGLQLRQRGSDRRARSSGDAVGPLAAIAIALLAFCVYDYSSYGHGFVSAFLGDSQRWFQGFVASFKLRM